MSISVFFFLAFVVTVVIVFIITRGACGGGGDLGPQRACDQCGTPNPPSATYCRKCGKSLR